MKASLEEYTYAVVAVAVAGLIILFLLSGMQADGFLEVLARRFSSMVLGIPSP